ncbi:serine hydrolase domain-containing protein [Actinorugispora endophytica]|uniref:CubicO group peptidase (Beta-lactamase class C family) n=1 Tax=Actinorugispora endophytica TaxID=1605990 RepID=A0A4R6V7T1_9ACTN|nr:serine hydrolase domain-containing protein [Actinorugispora endophytica]TDQ55176.1 CubicO group peptidase (beta-lactamase class C family) [Actinorugispora endophytica]
MSDGDPESPGGTPRRGTAGGRRGALVGCVAVVVALVGPLAGSAGALSGPVDEPVSAAELDRFAEAHLERVGLPGATIAVTRGDQVVHTGGYGYDSEGNPMRPDTPMRIASLSKSMTALAVMQLVDRGDVELDRPVRDYLAEFEIADPRGDEITVRQLLDQSSGMSDRTFHDASRPHQPGSLTEAVAQMRDAGLAADPGAEWTYHNPNYHVAARLVEVVGGEPFEEYLESRVFEPAGMRDTWSLGAADSSDQAPALGHIRAYGVNIAVTEPDGFSTGSGGVVSTAEDMARWLILQGDGGRLPDGTPLVSAEAVEEMHTPSAPNGRYALGWMRRAPEDSGGSTQVWHGGVVSTYSSYQVLVPETGYGIVVLFNSGITLNENDTGQMLEGLIALTEGRTPPSEGSVLWKVDAVFGALTLLVAALGVRGVLRARVWASRRAGRPWWATASRMLPHLVPPAVLLSANAAATFIMGGRDGTWLQRFYGIPAELIFLAVGALVSLAVLAARGVALSRVGRRPQPLP